MLISEHTHLISLKRSLEAPLRKVQQQLQELGACRSRLAAVLQERSRVTDLLCNSISLENYRAQTPRPITRSASSASLQSMPASARETPALKVELADRPATTSGLDTHPKTFSAPVPLELRHKAHKHGEIRTGNLIDLEPTASVPGKKKGEVCLETLLGGQLSAK